MLKFILKRSTLHKWILCYPDHREMTYQYFDREDKALEWAKAIVSTWTGAYVEIIR